jgi:putative transposase
MTAADRRAKVDTAIENLSVRRQCKLLAVARSSVYRSGSETSAEDLALMRCLDELHLKLPFYGSRRMQFELNKEGRSLCRKRVQRLMRVMDIVALVPRPGTSKPAPGHKIYPYLLRNVAITEPNHVWAIDMTYVPMQHGFLYLVAVIDWASRAVLAWRLSNTMDTRFCIEALDEALARYGKPKIFNSDQGSQGGLNRSSQHPKNWRLRWEFEGKGRIDVGDRHCDHLAAPLLQAAMSGSCSGGTLRRE